MVQIKKFLIFLSILAIAVLSFSVFARNYSSGFAGPISSGEQLIIRLPKYSKRLVDSTTNSDSVDEIFHSNGSLLLGNEENSDVSFLRLRAGDAEDAGSIPGSG